MTTYQGFAQKTISEKVTLITAEAVEQVKLFAVHSGAVYVRDVEHFVTDVRVFGLSLTKATSTSLTAGQYYFDPKQLKLYVRMIDDSNPKTKSVALYYRFFFSNAPYNLPFDLNSGEPVEFQARVQSIGSLGQQLDDQNTGIVLESSSSVTFENTDGYFDSIFDTLIWENQSIKFYSWSPSIPASQAQKLFEGVIESKDFSVGSVSFKVKDFVFKLKNNVALGLFSESDGRLEPSMIGKPKRRIYGQVKQLRCQGVDKVLDGFVLTGLVSVAIDTKALTGTGTSFLDQLSPGDELVIELEKETVKIGIESVDSNTAATLGQASRANIVNKPATVRPFVPWRKKNRVWHIAGHKLRAPSVAITEAIASNRYKAANTNDFFAGDSVKVNNEFIQIRRISGDTFVFQNSLAPAPVVNDLIEKNPVSKVFYQDRELIIDRDWNLSNTSEAILTINELAEFNIAQQRSAGVNLTFTNGSRVITTTASVDLRSILKTRDWIRKDSITETAWYEILDVKEQQITIRTPFSGTTQTTSGLIKIVDAINDDSLITVNCLGIEVAGEWVKTPAQAVRHLILNDALFDSVNEDSFNKAKASCDYILSLPIPETLGSKPPQIREIITKINESVFGSLYGNSSWAISYSILNSQKPESFQSLKDDDILSFDVVSDQKIINEIKVNFRPYTDIFSGSDAFESYSETSSFVDSYIGIKNYDEKTLYLFEEDKAKIIAQRMLFFRSLSNCKVQVKAKLNLALTSVNDKIFLELDRLYKRYGGRDRRKIGVVTSIKKNGSDTDVEFTDVGNIFNRVPSIAPNTASTYATATRNEIVQFGYVLDNDTLTPDVSSEDELGNNLIG